MIESRKIRDLSGLGSDVFRFTVRIGEAHVTIRQKIPTLSRNLGASRWKQRTGRIEVSGARDVPVRDRLSLSQRNAVGGSCHCRYLSKLRAGSVCSEPLAHERHAGISVRRQYDSNRLVLGHGTRLRQTAGPSVGRPPALVFISFYPLFGTARATAIFSARIDIITDSRRRLDELS